MFTSLAGKKYPEKVSMPVNNKHEKFSDDYFGKIDRIFISPYYTVMPCR